MRTILKLMAFLLVVILLYYLLTTLLICSGFSSKS